MKIPMKIDEGRVWDGKCSSCKGEARIMMSGYAENGAHTYLCQYHALQLVRKIMEDICDLYGGRHD
jgi:hypothetical protein